MIRTHSLSSRTIKWTRLGNFPSPIGIHLIPSKRSRLLTEFTIRISKCNLLRSLNLDTFPCGCKPSWSAYPEGLSISLHALHVAKCELPASLDVKKVGLWTTVKAWHPGPDFLELILHQGLGAFSVQWLIWLSPTSHRQAHNRREEVGESGSPPPPSHVCWGWQLVTVLSSARE